MAVPPIDVGALKAAIAGSLKDSFAKIAIILDPSFIDVIAGHMAGVQLGMIQAPDEKERAKLKQDLTALDATIAAEIELAMKKQPKKWVDSLKSIASSTFQVLVGTAEVLGKAFGMAAVGVVSQAVVGAITGDASLLSKNEPLPASGTPTPAPAVLKVEENAPVGPTGTAGEKGAVA